MGNEWNRWWSGRGAGGERPPEELARPTSQSKNDPEAAAEPAPVESKIDPNTLPDATGTKSENADAPIGETLPAIEPITAPPELADPREEAAPEFADALPSTTWDDLGADMDEEAAPEFADALPSTTRGDLGADMDMDMDVHVGADADPDADARERAGLPADEVEGSSPQLDPVAELKRQGFKLPTMIDGVFPAILNVLDLASRQQLLWLAVAHEDATTVAEALSDLFAEYGPPLVMKCDNGPAFRAHLTKRLLLSRDVFTLYSPPYCARYNGGCERANRTLKELTGHVADHAGRRDFWQSDDLLVARLRANRLTRPWGATGPTPQESWEARDTRSLDKRENMWQHLSSEIATVMDQRMIDPTVVLSHYIQTEIERIAAQPVLEQLGLLHITRRRITPAF